MPEQPQLAAAVVDLLPTGVVVVDAQGVVVSANPSARAMLVVSPTGLRPTRLRELVREGLRDGQPHEEILTLPQQLEPPLRRPRPDRAAPEARVRVLPMADGAVAVLLDDVTEQRRVDAVRRDFVANVSHELKTPVGAMHLLAEAIGECPDEPETVRRFATRMTAESERLSRLVQELIDLSRLQGAEPMERVEAIAVDTVIHEAVDRVRLNAETKGIDVDVRGQPGQIVAGDVRQLVTAVTNLLVNAVAYSPPGTRVTVGVVRQGAELQLSVADEGIGIAEADQERVFERFYRVDPARSRMTGGTGLGLAIVKHVATNHGGEVTLWSRPEAGSTFTLHLPVTDRSGGLSA